MSQQSYLALLDALAHRSRGLDPRAFREAQSLVVAGRRIDFSFEPNPLDEAESRIVLRCEIARLSEPASEALCRLLLRANNLWAGTRGATLGLRGDQVVIASEYARLASLNPERLAKIMAGLIEQVNAWATELDDQPFNRHIPLQHLA